MLTFVIHMLMVLVVNSGDVGSPFALTLVHAIN